MDDFTFGKDYKLCSLKDIEELFATGEGLKKYPLRVIYKKHQEFKPGEKQLRFVFSVPKRIQKHATDRNRIKRLLREAVRFQKHGLENLLQEKETKLNLIIIYLEKEELPLPVLEKKINKLFEELIKTLSNEIQ